MSIEVLLADIADMIMLPGMLDWVDADVELIDPGILEEVIIAVDIVGYPGGAEFALETDEIDVVLVEYAGYVVIAPVTEVEVGVMTLLTEDGREAATTPLPETVVVPVTWSKSVQFVPW